MLQRRNTGRSGSTAVVITLLGVALAVSVAVAARGRRRQRPVLEKFALAEVHRTEIHPSLMASGRIESSKKTVIECELENISIGIQGQRLYAGGSSVLLSIVPQGTLVRKGDVLAELDGSDYQEMLRQQQHDRGAVPGRLQPGRAGPGDHQAGRGRIPRWLHEGGDQGLRAERRAGGVGPDAHEGPARLDETDAGEGLRAARARSRTRSSTTPQALFNAGQERAAFELFTRWTAPKALRVLEGKVLGAEATYNYQRRRLNRNLERLSRLEKQVERCTIRAPHDGFVIYANNERRNIFIEPGMFVHQKQDLMYLPDLANMEVVAFLHESVVKQLSRGLRARVVVEGLHDRSIDGKLTAVAQVPTFSGTPTCATSTARSSSIIRPRESCRG